VDVADGVRGEADDLAGEGQGLLAGAVLGLQVLADVVGDGVQAVSVQ
jgi:hypothetical protein